MVVNRLVSIIVPIYGVEKYINKCIDSILKQTYRNIEVILVDDGSKDRCPEICDEYAKSDERVIVIHKENGGLVAARKAGILRATGEYVQFVDGDDWIAENMVEYMISAMDDHHVDCVICQFYKAGKKNVENKNYFPEGVYAGERYKKDIVCNLLFTGELFRYGITPSVWGKMFKLQQLKTYSLKVPEKIVMGEDSACVYPFFVNTCSAVFIMNHSLYYYRQNDTSIMNSFNKRQLASTLELLRYLRRETLCSNEFQKQLDYYTIMIVVLNCVNEARGEKMALLVRYKKLKKFLRDIEFKKICHRIDMKKLKRNEKIYVNSLRLGLGYPLLFLLGFKWR